MWLRAQVLLSLIVVTNPYCNEEIDLADSPPKLPHMCLHGQKTSRMVWEKIVVTQFIAAQKYPVICPRNMLIKSEVPIHTQ